MQNRIIVSLVILSFFVLACSREIVADPMCRTSAQYPQAAPSAAACLIKSNRKLLAVKNHNQEAWDLPKHKQKKATSAQCTAHAAAWKTTGLNVEIGKLLFTDQNQTEYFACKLTDNFSRQLVFFLCLLGRNTIPVILR